MNSLDVYRLLLKLGKRRTVPSAGESGGSLGQTRTTRADGDEEKGLLGGSKAMANGRA